MTRTDPPASQLTDLDTLVQESRAALDALKGAKKQLLQLAEVHQHFKDLATQYDALKAGGEEVAQKLAEVELRSSRLDAEQQARQQTFEAWLAGQEQVLRDAIDQQNRRLDEAFRNEQHVASRLTRLEQDTKAITTRLAVVTGVVILTAVLLLVNLFR